MKESRDTRVSDSWPYAREMADRMSARKRLTKPELAAEYHAMDSLCRREQWIEAVRGDDDYTDSERQGQTQMYGRLNTLHRFATLPHYDETKCNLARN